MVKLVWFRKIQLNMNKEIIKLTICYLKNTECFSESLIWIIFCFFICYYYCYYFIASWRWFLTYIHSNFGSMFFALSSLEFSLNPFMSYIYFQRLFFKFLFYYYFFICFFVLLLTFMFSPQVLSLVLYLYFRIFLNFVLLNCEV